jgi:hypothetical protein
MLSTLKSKIAAAVVLLALVIVPAPLLPPIGLAERVQSALGVGWKPAWLIAAIGLQVSLYGPLGVVAAFAVGPGETRRARWLRLALVPLAVVGIAIVIRSLKLGFVPMLANAVIPIAACVAGVWIALLLRQHGWRLTSGAALLLMGGLLWAHWPGVSTRLSRATEAQLRRLADAAPALPTGDERFGRLWQTAFAPAGTTSTPIDSVEQNRAAILAMGISIGHERLARLAGLGRHDDLVKAAIALRAGTTLRGREDWARHYCLSAALTVLESPFLSDTGGLIKEQLDALTHGSGFSFGDLAADRAGVRFAEVSTASAAEAAAMQSRLVNGYLTDDFFPPAADLPENLTTEQFRAEYGGVGTQRYRQMIADIEVRLERCAALSTGSARPSTVKQPAPLTP